MSIGSKNRTRRKWFRAGRKPVSEFPAIRVLLLVTLLCLRGPGALAMQSGNGGNAEMAALAAIETDIRALDQQFAAARGDNRESIRQRLWTHERKYREQVWNYIDSTDSSDSSQRVLAGDLLRKVSASLREQLAGNGDRIRELQLEVESSDGDAAASARQALGIAESHRMDLLDAMVRNIEHFQRFDLAVDEDRNMARVELRNRAQILSGRIELERIRRDTVRVRIKELDPESEEIAAARKQMGAAEAMVSRSAGQLSAVADLLEKLGEDVAEYRQTEFMATGDLSAEFLDRRVAGSILRRWYDDIRAMVLETGPDLLTRLLVVVVILLVFWFLARIVRVLVCRGLDNVGDDMSTLARNFLVGFSVKVVIISGILVALSQFGLKIGPLLAGLGIVGFIVGFALQDTLSNFASGIMILVYRPFDVGDYVQAAGVEGEVRRMNLVSTTVHTPENHRLIIPNNRIWGDIIRNITSQAVRRVDLTVGVSYEDDVEQVEQLLEEIVSAHDRVKPVPEPVIRLHNLGDSAVEFTVRAWVDSDDYMTVYWDLTRQIKLSFDARGIRFPYPQRTVHLVSGDDVDVRA